MESPGLGRVGGIVLEVPHRTIGRNDQLRPAVAIDILEKDSSLWKPDTT